MNCKTCENYQTDACSNCLMESDYTDVRRAKKLKRKRKRLQGESQVMEIGEDDVQPKLFRVSL